MIILYNILWINKDTYNRFIIILVIKSKGLMLKGHGLLVHSESWFFKASNINHIISFSFSPRI